MSRVNIKRSGLLMLLIATAVWAAACGGSDSGDNDGGGSNAAKSASNLKVAAISGSRFDASGYGHALLSGFDMVHEKLGIEIHTVESVPYTKKWTEVTEQLLGPGGYDVVFDTGVAKGLFYDACKKSPGKHCIEYFPYPLKELPPNTGGQLTDYDPAYYAEGVAAGLLSKSGRLGFVADYKTPITHGYVNSFALGCQAVKPGCEMRVIYINSFFSPPDAINAANTLINSGADVIGHSMDDTSVLNIASKRGVWSFSHYVEPSAPVPEKYVTADLWAKSIGNALITQLGAIADGSWQQAQMRTVYGTPKPLDTQLAAWGPNVPADVQSKTEAVVEKMNSGWTPYRGPIYDSNGKLRIKPGVTLSPRSDFIQAGWDWTVKGVTGG